MWGIVGIALGTWLTFVPPLDEEVEVYLYQDTDALVYLGCVGEEYNIDTWTKEEGIHAFILPAGKWYCEAKSYDDNTVIMVEIEK